MLENNLNKDKIIHFYKEVIEFYKPQIKESYWGSKDDFIDLIEQVDELPLEQDNVKITCKNGQEINFPQTLFNFLFKGDSVCIFQHTIGQRYEYEGYIFIELIESPIVSIGRKSEKTGVFSITKDENGNIESCFFIKSEEQGKNYDYSYEILPFFVSQMKNRLKIFEDILPSYFPDHFEPMKYILKIKKEQTNLLIKLLYKLGANLGIVESGAFDDSQKIIVEQEIQTIIDNENNINLTNEYSENLDSLNFYISAIRNINPYYRFLDAYRILETFSYKYFYNYVRNLNNHMDKEKLYVEIREHTKDQQMLKLVLMNHFDNQHRMESIKNALMNIEKIGELAKSVKRNYNIGKWPTDNAEKFNSGLSDLICEFRNAIVHSKKSTRHIEKIKGSPNLITAFIDLTNIVLKIAEYALNKNIEKW